jgi:hypothetical protein
MDRLSGSITSPPITPTAGTATVADCSCWRCRLVRERWLKAQNVALRHRLDAAEQVIEQMIEEDFERSTFAAACRAADERHKQQETQHKPRPWPTPQTTIEAILYGVKARGLAALRELDNKRRLSMCDRAAKQQINERIAKMGL